ncbi:MAG TPA: MFS transporter [Blastocatellia bacterium]|nr:MFS transporter [Blastocatellia bacterium]
MRDEGTDRQNDGATGRRGDEATEKLSDSPSISPSPGLSGAPSPRRSVSPALLVIWAEGFLSRLSFGVISFALPIFAYKRLGLSLTQTGFLFSLNLIAEQLFKPLMGWVADRAGLKRTLTVAIALRSVVPLALAFAASPLQIYAIRFFHGFTESLRDPSVNALIAANAKKKSVASAFAWYSTAKMSAGSMGKALGGLLIGLMVDNYSAVFLIAFALSLAPLMAVARYLKEPEDQADAEENESHVSDEGPKGKGPALFPIAVLGFLIASAALMISNLFPLLATEYAKLSPAQAGLIYMITPLLTIVSGPAFGWLSDNVSRKLVLMVRGAANTFSSAMFFFFPTFAGMAAGSVVDAMGKAAFRPAWGALMAQFSNLDRRRRARTMSYLSLGEGLGETLGPLLGGFLWSVKGVGVMLGVRVALAAVAEIYALIIARSVKDGMS